VALYSQADVARMKSGEFCRCCPGLHPGYHAVIGARSAPYGAAMGDG